MVGRERGLHRVLFLSARADYGGGPQHLYGLLTHLDRQRFVPYVACPREVPYAERFAEGGATVVVLPLRRLSLATLLRLVLLVKRQRIDLIHSHGKGAGLYGRLVARLTGVRVVHTFHGLHYHRYGRLAQWLYLRLERLLATWSDRLIHVSQAEQGEAGRLGLSPGGKGKVIVNGIDWRRYDPATVTIDVVVKRKELGLFEPAVGQAVIGCVARFDPVKGHRHLLEALPMVIHTASLPAKVCLLLVGEGECMEEARRQVERQGLAGHVIFAGSRQDVAELYRIMDLYVAPSLWEGLPLAVLEAMASALPVVATDQGGHREVVLAGETGLLVPPADACGLAKGMLWMLNHPQEATRMGWRGRQRVQSHFSLQGMVRQTEALYGELLG